MDIEQTFTAVEHPRHFEVMVMTLLAGWAGRCMVPGLFIDSSMVWRGMALCDMGLSDGVWRARGRWCSLRGKDGLPVYLYWRGQIADAWYILRHIAVRKLVFRHPILSTARAGQCALASAPHHQSSQNHLRNQNNRLKILLASQLPLHQNHHHNLKTWKSQRTETTNCVGGVNRRLRRLE